MPQIFNINRPPRRYNRELPFGESTIPSPPKSLGGSSSLQSMLHAILPLVTMVGYILVVTLVRGSGSMRLLFIIPMGLTMVASFIFSWHNIRKNKKQYQQQENLYREQLDEIRRQIETTHENQRQFFYQIFPPSYTLLKIAETAIDDCRNGLGTRLWERRPADPDFGAMILGTGHRPSTVTFKQPHNAEIATSLSREAILLSTTSQFVTDTAVNIHLRKPASTFLPNDNFPVACHSLSVFCKQRNLTMAYINDLIVQYTSLHAPTDAQLLILGQSQQRSEWQWVSSLPHCQGLRDGNLCFETNPFWYQQETSVTTTFLKELRHFLEQRRLRLSEHDSKTDFNDICLPFLLIVVDLFDAPDAHLILSKLETDPTISLLMKEGTELGTAIMFLSPQPGISPSGCYALLELDPPRDGKRKEVEFRYQEIGINAIRHHGRANLIWDKQALEQYAKHLKTLNLVQPYGDDIPTHVDFLEMFEISDQKRLQDHILENWHRSKSPNHSNWLTSPIGKLSGNTKRWLTLYSRADGVHGMIAGINGSGKSELLRSLILALAVQHDPSILNFVLVDFKGGGAFDPFHNLPHCVELVTNLQKGEVDRFFEAVQAEIEKRQRLNAKTGSDDIVEYRRRGLHVPPYGGDIILRGNVYKSRPFPHLVIVIDEYSEMIGSNDLYKEKLDKIARLGRALGISLILASQRPKGITDQMLANINWRICLRVKTREESMAILRRPDAAYLPIDIPGRAILQIGNEVPEELQIGYAGGTYSQERKNPLVIWHNRPAPNDFDEELPKLYEVVTNTISDLACEHSLPQTKPWPNPLQLFSLHTPIDTTYMPPNWSKRLNTWQNKTTVKQQVPDHIGQKIALNPFIESWMNDRADWPVENWYDPTVMQPTIGLIDNPTQAQQTPLNLDLTNGHAALFGAPGWGKTTFLKTTITYLATTHSPNMLHIYILDFGDRHLKTFNQLPHVGAVITVDEEERVQRFLRMMHKLLETRRRLLSESGLSDIYSYNKVHPESAVPVILVAIDNFAQFKEGYEELLPSISALVRETLSCGIHFIITADAPGSLSGRLFNSITSRLALTMADAADQMAIAGRTTQHLAKVPGRGLIKKGNQTLHFQIAYPIGEVFNSDTQAKQINLLAQKMMQSVKENWTKPETVGILPKHVALNHIVKDAHANWPIAPSSALDDLSLQPWQLNLSQDGPHFLVVGPPNSGKTTALQSIILSTAYAYAPEQVTFVLIDMQRRLFAYGGNETLANLPHEVQTINHYDQTKSLIPMLLKKCHQLESKSMRGHATIVVIDNFVSFTEEIIEAEGLRGSTLTSLTKMARQYGSYGLNFIIASDVDDISTQNPLIKQVMASRFGLALQTLDSVVKLRGRPPKGVAETLPSGRGFVVKSATSQLVQWASPVEGESSHAAALDKWIDTIRNSHNSLL